MLVRRHAAIAELRARIPTLPPSLDGSWSAVRVERAGSYDFGPANMEIVMWFPVRDEGVAGDGPTWATVEAEVGPVGEAGEAAVNQEALAALLPGRFERPAWGAINVRVAGPLYPASCFEGGGFGAGRAVRIDGGLLVAITTAPAAVPRTITPTVPPA